MQRDVTRKLSLPVKPLCKVASKYVELHCLFAYVHQSECKTVRDAEAGEKP